MSDLKVCRCGEPLSNTKAHPGEYITGLSGHTFAPVGAEPDGGSGVVTKSNYTIRDDGSVTFSGDVTPSEREKAYLEAAALVAKRERAGGFPILPGDEQAPDPRCALCGEHASVHTLAACDRKMADWKPTGLLGTTPRVARPDAQNAQKNP